MNVDRESAVPWLQKHCEVNGKVDLLYRLFFLFYGGIHLVAGMFIAIQPQVMTLILHEAPPQGVGVLLGFISFLAGLGFLGGAGVKSISNRLMFIRLAIIGSFFNSLAHLVNVLRGDEKFIMGTVSTVAAALFIVVLLYLYRKLKVTA